MKRRRKINQKQFRNLFNVQKQMCFCRNLSQTNKKKILIQIIVILFCLYKFIDKNQIEFELKTKTR